MAPLTPRLVVPIEVKKHPWEQKVPLHNRWHPDIPPVADVTEGELFRVEMVDWSGGRVRDDNSADDMKCMDFTIAHYLSGPLRIVDSEGVPASPEWLLFEGISVDESGKQHFLDASVAYKRAVLNAIEYLSRFGYSREQVYLLLSCCPCEGRISGIVDAPNAVTTLAIPTAIFDQII
nr:unnamed protein product [Digitaria exilis]